MNKAVKNTIAVIAILLVVGGIAGAAFYQDEVGGFIRLQGWNTGPVTEASKQFIQAAAKNDGKKVAALLATDSPTLQPVKDGESVRAFKVAAYGGPKTVTLKELCPSDSPKLDARLVYLEGGSVLVEGRYPDGLVVGLKWDRKPDGWRVVDVSQNKL